MKLLYGMGSIVIGLGLAVCAIYVSRSVLEFLDIRVDGWQFLLEGLVGMVAISLGWYAYIRARLFLGHFFSSRRN